MGFLGKKDKGQDQNKRYNSNKQNDGKAKPSATMQEGEQSTSMQEGGNRLEADNSEGKFRLSATAMHEATDLTLRNPETGQTLYDSKTRGIDSFSGNVVNLDGASSVEVIGETSEATTISEKVRESVNKSRSAVYNHRPVEHRKFEAEVLDKVEKAVFGIGLRRLDGSYNGPCLEVMNVDGERTNIGFHEDDLDWKKLRWHTRGLEAYVTKIYDQSGNGFMLSQDTQSFCPQIDADLKALVFNDGQYMDGNLEEIQTAATVLSHVQFSITDQNSADYDYVYQYGIRQTSDMFSLSRHDGPNGSIYYAFDGSSPRTGSKIWAHEWTTFTQLFSNTGTTHQLYKDGVADSVLSFSNFGNTSKKFILGAYSTTGTSDFRNFFSGYFRELAIIPRVVEEEERLVLEQETADYWPNLEEEVPGYLETVRQAVAGFSLRRVNPLYTGPCVRVQLNTGQQYDLGFGSDQLLDYTRFNALLTKHSAIEGRIARWYDQMDDGNFISQSTYANMPLLDATEQAAYLGGTQRLEGQIAQLDSAASMVTSFDYELENQDLVSHHLYWVGDRNTHAINMARRQENAGGTENAYYTWNGSLVSYGPLLYPGNRVYAQTMKGTSPTAHKFYENERLLDPTITEDIAAFGQLTTFFVLGGADVPGHDSVGFMDEFLLFDRVLTQTQIQVLSIPLNATHRIYPVLDMGLKSFAEILEVGNPLSDIKPVAYPNTNTYDLEIYRGDDLELALTGPDSTGAISLYDFDNLQIDTEYLVSIKAHQSGYSTGFGGPRRFSVPATVPFDPLLLSPVLWFDPTDSAGTALINGSAVAGFRDKAQALNLSAEILTNPEFTGALVGDTPSGWSGTNVSVSGDVVMDNNRVVITNYGVTDPVLLYQDALTAGKLYQYEIKVDLTTHAFDLRGLDTTEVLATFNAAGTYTGYFTSKDTRLTLYSAQPSEANHVEIDYLRVKEVIGNHAIQNDPDYMFPAKDVGGITYAQSIWKELSSNDSFPWMTVPNYSGLNTNEISIVLAYRADSTTTAGGGFALGTVNGAAGTYSWKVDFNGSEVRLTYYDGTNEDYARITTPDNGLHIYAFSLSTTSFLYSIDGGTMNTIGRSNGAIDYSTPYDLQIGANTNALSGFNGLIGDLVIYDRALESASLTYLANGLMEKHNVGKYIDIMPYAPAMWIDPADEEKMHTNNWSSIRWLRTILDNSKNLELGPELLSKDIFRESAWTHTVNPNWTVGPLTLVSDGTSGSLRSYAMNFEQDHTYLTSATITRNSGNFGLPYTGSGLEIHYATSTGDHDRFLTVSWTPIGIYSNNFDGTVHSLSIREIYGNHIWNTDSSAYRYDRHPIRGHLGLHHSMIFTPRRYFNTLRDASLENQEFSVVLVKRFNNRNLGTIGAVSMGIPFSSPVSFSWRFEFNVGTILALISDGTNQIRKKAVIPDDGVHVYEMNVSATHVSVYIDGVLTADVHGPPLARDGLQINYSNGYGMSIGTSEGAETSMEGMLGDVMYFPRSLSDTERLDISKGLLAKYYVTWADLMIASYRSLHAQAQPFYYANSFAQLEEALQPGGYFYKTFGPDGQNKTTCDFLYMFELAGATLAGPASSKLNKTSGTLRWDIEGTITELNGVPAHDSSKNINNSRIAILSSETGFDDVTLFEIEGQGFSGPLPKFNLPSAATFRVGSNSFSRIMPDHYLPVCHSFYAYGNNFSWKFPAMDLPNVTDFRIHGNSFSYAFPDDINMPNAEIVRIDTNNFTGNLNYFAGLTNLKVLNARETSLTGTIPAFVSTDLYSIDLSSTTGLTSYTSQTLSPAFTNINLQGLNLSQTHIDAILSDLAVNAATKPIMFVDLSGGSMSAPSSTGVDDLITLAAAGHTILTNADWEDRMLADYLARNGHGTYSQAVQDELQSRLSSGYLYDTFGPNGQNKTECDFVYLLEFTIETKTQTSNMINSGATLRWDIDGSVYDLNAVPNHAIGSGAGIATVSSTDGWTGVTEFMLNGNNFTNVLPNFAMPNLVDLRFENNNFTGNMPLFDLPLLEVIVGYYNEFSGPFPEFNFPELESFYISYSGITGTLPNFNFPKCTFFAVNGNELTGTVPNLAMPDMTVLNIYKNNFTGTLPAFNMPVLRKISLYDNGFTGDFPDLSASTAIEEITANLNGFTGWATQPLASTLETLNLKDCSLSSTAVDAIITELAPTAATRATLNAQLDGTNAAATSASNTNLLSLFGNGHSIAVNATDWEMSMLEDYLQRNSHAPYSQTVVDELYNRLSSGYLNTTFGPTGQNKTECDFVYLFEYTGDVTFIANNNDRANHPLHWNFDGTEFTQAVDTLPAQPLGANGIITLSHTNNWSNITGLECGDSTLTGYLPKMSLPNTDRLTFIYTSLTGTIPTMDMPALRWFYLYRNDFTGIQEQNLPNCRTFRIYYQNIAGDLPTLTLPLVDAFNVESNPITGTIGDLSVDYPLVRSFTIHNTLISSVADQNLPELQSWWVYDMVNMTGPAPNIVAPKMASFLMFDCHFGGAMPNYDFPLCTDFRCHENDFTSVPALNLPSVTRFRLHTQNCNSACPNFNLPAVETIVISNCGFTGTVPAFNFPNLTYLDVSNNNFTGFQGMSVASTVTHFLIQDNSLDATAVDQLLADLAVNATTRTELDADLRGTSMAAPPATAANDLYILAENGHRILSEAGWTDSMMVDYLMRNSHGTYSQAAKDEFKSRLSSGYLYDTFGPAGQNKPVCDFVFLLEFETETVATVNSENSLADLRWDINGNVFNDNNVPAQHVGTADGIATVSSTDTWAGLTKWYINDNNFKNVLPNFHMSTLVDLRLHNNDFTGDFPAWSLPNLDILFCYYNEFSGPFPAFDMPKMRYFYMSYNDLAGPIPDYDMPLMEYFYIHGNDCTGQMPHFNFPKCKAFTTYGNNFSGTLPAFDFPDCTVFNVHLSGFTGTFPNLKLPKATSFTVDRNTFTGNCPNLYMPDVSIFRIYDCGLTGDLPAFQFPNVTEFDVSLNGFSGDITRFNFPLVEKFRVDGNSFTGYLGSDIGPACTEFDIQNNDLTQPALDRALADLAVDADTRATLTVNITGPDMPDPSYDGGVQLYDLLNNGHTVNHQMNWGALMARNYAYLNRHASYSTDAMAELSYRMGSGQYLYNAFGPSGTVAQKTTCDFVYMLEIESGQSTVPANAVVTNSGTTLRWDMERTVTTSNLIPAHTRSGNGIITVSSEDGWTGVTNFDISDNNLTGPVPNFNMPNLTSLHLGGNNMTGGFPALDLSNLTQLYLYGNELSGPMPADLSVPAVTHIYFYDNNLTGEFPVYNWPSIHTLAAHTNQFSGTFPAMDSNSTLANVQIQANGFTELADQVLPNLYYFQAYWNKFSGPFPTFNAPLLRFINLGGNHFTGPAPTFNSTILEQYSFSVNHFSGEFPALNQPLLENLVIGVNNFHGNLPDISAFPNFYALNAEENQFTGYTSMTVPTGVYNYRVHTNNLPSQEVDKALADFRVSIPNRNPSDALIMHMSGTGMGAPEGQGIRDRDYMYALGHSMSFNAPTDIQSYLPLVWVDPTDDQALVTYDDAGTTKVERPFNMVLGSDLILNGDFTDWPGGVLDDWTTGNTDSNNTITESSGAVRLLSDGTISPTIYQTVLTVGELYRLEYQIISITSGSLRIGSTASTDHDEILNTAAVTGVRTLHFVAQATDLRFTTAKNTATDIVLDNVKVIPLSTHQFVTDASNLHPALDTENQLPVFRSNDASRAYIPRDAAFENEEFTAFIVASRDNITSGIDGVISQGPMHGSHAWQIAMGNNYARTTIKSASTGANHINYIFSDHELHLFEYRVSSTTEEFYVDGNFIGSQDRTGIAPLNFTSTKHFYLFGSGGSNGLDGEVGDAIYFPRQINSSERQLVTDYLIEKYNLNWAQRMLDSYLEIHNHELPSQGAQDELLNRLQPGGYLYDTFGPNGQNRTKCDFVYLFEFSGTAGNGAISNSGDTLRWDDGTNVNVQNNHPPHSGSGYKTVSSTDYWVGVTSIYMNGCGYLGALPKLSMPNLTNLQIHDNTFSGNCPDLYLPALRTLVLRGNEFSGDCPNFVFPDIFQFHIYDNEFSGDMPAWDFPKMQDFRVYDNNFTGNLPAFDFPDCFRFDAQLNNMTGLVPTMGLPKVEVFWINNNDFSGLSPQDMPECTSFYVHVNPNMTGDFPVCNLPKVDYLYGYNNNFTGTFPAMDLPVARRIYFYNNDFTGLPEANLVDWSGLEAIHFSGNSNLAQDFPLYHAPNLWYVNYTGCDITGDIELMNLDLRYPDMRQFWMDGNEMSGHLPTLNWPILQYITLGNNSLTSIADQSLPQCLYFYAYGNTFVQDLPDFDLPLATRFYIYNCGFTGTNPTFNFPNMQYFYIQGNDFEGTFPTYNWPDLVQCQAQSNNFTTLQSQNWPNATHVYFNDNELAGSLPSLTLPKVDWLHLNDNEFTGAVPGYDFPECTRLYLYRNNLDSLPDASSLNLPKLQYFNVHSNPNLTGSIPNYSFPQLLHFTANACDFTGPLPAFNFPLCTFINISYNRLDGVFPTLNTPELLEIHAQGCKFSGMSTQNLPKLTLFYLYANEMTGNFPAMTLPACELFYIYSNQFTGNFPAISMPNCRYFLIRYNQFTGTMPDPGSSALLGYTTDNCSFDTFNWSSASTSIVYFTAPSNQLSQASVDQVLSVFATNINSRPSNFYLYLHGSPNSAPSDPDGLADKTTILNSGRNVLTT